MAGPELLLIEQGSVTITDSFGFSTQATAPQPIALGTAATYELANTGIETATLLRFSVAAGSDTPPAQASPVRSLDASPVASPVVATAEVDLLLAQPVTVPFDGPATLVIARLTLDADSTTGPLAHAGPVGLVVEEGALQVVSPSGMTGNVASGAGVVLPAETPLRATNTNGETATALIVSVMPETSEFFSLVTPTPTPTAEPTQIPIPTETPVPTPTTAPTSTPVPTPTSTPPAAGMVLYEADVSAGGFEDWSPSGTWQVFQGMLVSDGTSAGWIMAPYQSTTDNYAVEVELQVVQSGRNSGYAVGAYDTGITADYDPAFGFSLYVSRDRLAADFIGDYGDEPQWHTFRLEVQDNMARFLVDGAAILQGVDNRILSASPGKSGVYSGEGWQINVRSFKVVALGDASSANALPSSDESPRAAAEESASSQGSDRAARIADMLPTEGEMPPGLVLIEDGQRSTDVITATFPDPADAARRFEEWGWKGSVFRVFAVPDDTGADPNQTSLVDVSIHRFESADDAAEALPYIANARAQLLGLEPWQIPQIGDQSVALSGRVGDAIEVTVYTRNRSAFIRITATSPAGDPTADAVAVAQTVVAK